MVELVRVRVKGSHFDHLIEQGTEGGTLCGRLEWRETTHARPRKPRVCGACASKARAVFPTAWHALLFYQRDSR